VAVIPGYNVTIKISGTAVAFTNEATTKLTANTVYQITDTTKRIVDPNAAVTVEVDADGAGGGSYAAAAAADFVMGYNFGKVTFAADQGSSALVRVSGSYLPMLTVAEGRGCSIKQSRTELDKTILGDTVRSFLLGLKHAEGSIDSLSFLSVDLDAGAGTVIIDTLWADGTPKLLEVALGTLYWRGWVLLKETGIDVSADDLVKSNIGWVACAQPGSGQSEFAVFGVGS
jgi:hypothetical protein